MVSYSCDLGEKGDGHSWVGKDAEDKRPHEQGIYRSCGVVTLTVVLVDAIIRLSGNSQMLSLLLLQLGVDEHTMIVAWGDLLLPWFGDGYSRWPLFLHTPDKLRLLRFLHLLSHINDSHHVYLHFLGYSV